MSCFRGYTRHGDNMESILQGFQQNCVAFNVCIFMVFPYFNLRIAYARLLTRGYLPGLGLSSIPSRSRPHPSPYWTQQQMSVQRWFSILILILLSYRLLILLSLKTIHFPSAFQSQLVKSRVHQIATIFVFIKSILKSLVILAIWLALNGAIYSRIALFFALNRIFFSANEHGPVKHNNPSDFKISSK